MWLIYCCCGSVTVAAADSQSQQRITHNFLRGLKITFVEQVNNRNPTQLDEAMAFAQQAEIKCNFDER